MISIGDIVSIDGTSLYVINDIRLNDNKIYEYYIIPFYRIGLSSEYKWMRETEFRVCYTVQERIHFLERSIYQTKQKYKEL